MKHYRITAQRKNLLKRIGIELGKFLLVAGAIMFLGLLNGLVEMM